MHSHFLWVEAPAAFVASIYLAIPYLIEQETAIALGISISALTVYDHLGRSYTRISER